ncbi:MAG: VWA domain-containing protein [Candidatus Cloacimonadota bacterium]|nr:MAG: VWA domain-containing protein [Candidatus Cloacimonadota bacterium]
MFHLLHPFYLLGLFLTSVPLILHLLGRRRIKERPFSSLFLLKEIKKSSSIWMRIKDLILLLLRIFFILFIVIGFSHPLVLSPVPFLGKEAPKDVAILIDVSMSMGAEGVFEKAKQEVKEVFGRLGSGNSILLIAFSDRIEEEREIIDEAELNSFLDHLKVTFRSTDMLPPLDVAKKELLKREGFSKEIFIVSDFQKSALKNIQSIYSNLRKKKINVYASCIEGSRKNIFFTGFQIEPPFPLPGLRLKIFPELISNEKGSIPVELFMGGVMKGIKKTEERKDVFFEIEPGKAGYKSGFFRTKGDSLTLDNNYYFSFYVPENLNILLVGKGTEYFYLANALSPGIKTPIKLTTIEPVKLSRINPSQYNLLILYNIKFDGYVKARTMDFLRNGGGVLFVMGNEFLSEVNKNILEEIHIVKKNDSKKGFFSIKTVDTGFKPLSDFKDKGLKNLYDTKFFQYFTIKSNMKAVIQGRNGDPMMLAGNINGGEFVLFPFAFNPEWTQLPLKAIFVPLVYRLTFYLAARQEKLPENQVGEPIKISVSKKVKQPLFILPDGKKKSPTFSTTGDDYILKDTELPGIYKFIPQLGETISIAVNVKEEESRLDVATFEELEFLFPDINKSEKREGFATSGKRWIDLFPFFIILSLLFLTAELVLENK